MTDVGTIGLICHDILNHVNAIPRMPKKIMASVAIGIEELFRIEREQIATEKKHRSEIRRLNKELQREKEKLYTTQRML